MLKKLLLVGVALLLTGQLLAQDRLLYRLPEINGYKIIKCDLHNHTVFSDGQIWPDLRVGEAWLDGLDVMAITDHIEYQPHKDDLPTNHNRSFEIARGAGAAAGITVLKGAEITRDMPPGHFNAIFINDTDSLDTTEWRDVFAASAAQGAFIFRNHPGWTGQEDDGIGKWYPEIEELHQKGLIHGMEVVNDDSYYPEVHQWCIDKKIAMLGNSDVHGTTNIDFNLTERKHRPMTWVLAADNSPAAIKEALFARRTIVYWRDQLIGEEQYLAPLFAGCVKLETPAINRKAWQGVQLANVSDLVFELELKSAPEGVFAPAHVTLPPGRAARLAIRFDKEKSFEQIKLDYEVTNLKVTPASGLPVSWTVGVK